MRAIVRYCRALTVEWVSLPSAYCVPLLGWGVTAIVAAAQANLYADVAAGADFQRLWVATYQIAQIFPILIGGSWALMGENAGGWRSEGLMFPWPGRALLIRAGAAALSGGIWALTATGAVAFGMDYANGTHLFNVSVEAAALPALLLGATYHGAATALLTFAVARLTGHAPTAIGAVIALFILISPLLSPLGVWARYLPGNSGLAVVGAQGPHYLSATAGSVVLGLWALAAIAATYGIRQRVHVTSAR